MKNQNSKSPLIIIIDIGIGNIYSVEKAFLYLDVDVKVSIKKEDFLQADAFVIPGDGAYQYAMQSLQKMPSYSTFEKQILYYKKPLLGICIGFQMLFSSSTEMGYSKGLNWLIGDLKKFDSNVGTVPHIGWEQTIFEQKDHPLLKNILSGSYFYYIHSYYVPSKHLNSIATANYQETFTSIVSKDNIYGVQFHPEKSDKSGLQLLKNFIELSVPVQ